jgi:hypothetical protein
LLQPLPPQSMNHNTCHHMKKPFNHNEVSQNKGTPTHKKNTPKKSPKSTPGHPSIQWIGTTLLQLWEIKAITQSYTQISSPPSPPPIFLIKKTPNK